MSGELHFRLIVTYSDALVTERGAQRKLLQALRSDSLS